MRFTVTPSVPVVIGERTFPCAWHKGALLVSRDDGIAIIDLVHGNAGQPLAMRVGDSSYFVRAVNINTETTATVEVVRAKAPPMVPR